MKKILSILLAVILAFSAFTMVSFAEGTENTEATTGTTDAPEGTTDEPKDIKDSMCAKWTDENLNTGFDNIELAVKVVDNFNSTVTMYIKGGKMAIETPVELGLFTLKMKMIADANSGNFSIYCPSLPFFYMDFDAPSDYSDALLDTLFVDYSNFVLERAYYSEHDGSEYYVEKIRDTETNADMYYYFKDGELVRMETHGSDSSTFILEFSCDVSDKDVELPFYAFIDVTPFIEFIYSLGLI